MSSEEGDPTAPAAVAPDRKESVLDSALVTFSRFGFRKTSMEDVAQAAEISRPGLYFLFSSKGDLFRAAVTQSLTRDLTAAETVLRDTERPLPDRLLVAFDHWAGRYVGPMAREIGAVIDDNPVLLGTITKTAPRRFEKLVTDAIAVELGGGSAAGLAQTLISTSIGIKHQVETRRAYRDRLKVALDVMLPVKRTGSRRS